MGVIKLINSQAYLLIEVGSAVPLTYIQKEPILYLSILMHTILNSLCIIESVNNTINCWQWRQRHTLLEGQQARGKLQIADGTEQWANEYKTQNNGLTNINVSCCNRHLEISYSSKQVDDAPSELKEFYKIKEI
jgi:hypothetical protein